MTSDRPISATRLVIGLLLVLVGVGGLLQAVDVVDVPWRAVLAVVLVGLGVALLVARERGHGALVTAGVILTVVLAIGSVLDVSFAGGVGERHHRVEAATDLEGEYRLAVGSMTVDLARLEASPGTTTIEASVGIGELVLIVPPDASVRVRGRAGAGQVVLFGREHNGIGVEERFTAPGFPGTAGLDLDLSVGLGKVEVRR